MNKKLKTLILIFINFLYKKKLMKINLYKNIHKNEECYIIGGGVSIKYFDLEKFKDKKSFILNFTIFHNQYDKIDSNYLVLFDPFWFFPFERARKDITDKQQFIWKTLRVVPNKIQIKYRKLIRKHKQKIFFHHISNAPLLFGKNICFISNKLEKNEIFDEFVKNELNPFKSSLRLTIFLAIHMGFKKVHLVGCDYTFKPSINSHWFEKGFGFPNTQIENYEKAYFEFCSRYIEILTVTNEKVSYVLPYVTYESLFNTKEKFQENTDLINEDNLKTLATWPGFNI
jgi:hypothetical protein